MKKSAKKRFHKSMRYETQRAELEKLYAERNTPDWVKRQIWDDARAAAEMVTRGRTNG